MKAASDTRHGCRRSLRLSEYDYRRSGAYYVTVCTQDRACLFGEVVDGVMRVSDAGRMGLDTWHALSDRFPTVRSDAFVVMPNHIHGIIVIASEDAADTMPGHVVPIVDAPAVGAGLVPARDDAPMDDGAIVGAGLVPACDDAPMDGGAVVGAGLAPARDDAPMDDGAVVGAGLAPARDDAPMDDGVVVGAGLAPARDDVPMDDGVVVGAGLVPARDDVPMDDGVVVGAGLVPARDDAPMDDGAVVGAGLVPAHDRATTRVAPTLGDVIGAFKSITTVAYIRGARTHGWPAFGGRLWQRNYHEHVIRNGGSLDRIRRYILDNPRRWSEDRYNPNARGAVEEPQSAMAEVLGKVMR